MAFDTRRFDNSSSRESSGGNNFDEHILPKGAVLQSRYEIIKVLGVGGMGAVYLAQDLRFQPGITLGQ